MSTVALPPVRFRISRYRTVAWWGSALACLLSLVGMVLCWLSPTIGLPLKPGLDFTGGTQIQLERQCTPACLPLKANQVQERLRQLNGASVEQQNAPLPSLDTAQVQLLDGGRSLLIRLPELTPEQANLVTTSLASVLGPLNPAGTAVNTIGPTLGDQLLRGSLVSLLVSFAAIAAYITFRYDRVYAALALVCLAHDVLITCGVFAWLGLLRGVEVDSLFAVSLITVAGYSVTDTVVVFDRIREQQTTLAALPVVDQVDVAVDATLTRSLYTSLTTLLPLLALIFFGGSTLFWFAIALTVGISVGSWSSIGVAPTLLPVFARR